MLWTNLGSWTIDSPGMGVRVSTVSQLLLRYFSGLHVPHIHLCARISLRTYSRYDPSSALYTPGNIQRTNFPTNWRVNLITQIWNARCPNDSIFIFYHHHRTRRALRKMEFPRVGVIVAWKPDVPMNVSFKNTLRDPRNFRFPIILFHKRITSNWFRLE